MMVNDMKLVILVFLLLFTGILDTSCQRNYQDKDMEAFMSESDQAKKLLLEKNDPQGSELHYNSALRIAEKMNWKDGIVMTKAAIAGIYTSKDIKQYEIAEAILNDAKEICISSKDCSGEQLASVLGDLMFLYLFWTKDIAKASTLVDETIASKEKLSQSETEDLDSLLNDFVRQMRTAGFDKEALELEKKVKWIK